MTPTQIFVIGLALQWTGILRNYDDLGKHLFAGGCVICLGRAILSIAT